MTLDEILEKPKIYECFAPMDPQLQRSVQIASFAIGAVIPVGLFCAPALVAFAHIGLLGGGLGLAALSVPLLALVSSPLFVAVNVLVLGLYGLVWYKTNGLQAGHLIWHRAGLGISAVGAVNVLAISVPIAIGVVSIVVTLAAIIAVLFIVLAALGGGAVAR
jgi:hypothetical protein